MMGKMKYMGALALGGGRYLYATKVLGRANPCKFTITLMAAAGYAIGGSQVNKLVGGRSSTSYEAEMDQDIINAFET